MTKYIAKFQTRMAERGATAVEYALMAGLIAVVIVAAVTIFGRNVIGLFNVPSSVFNP
jgi:pilus assembly protein Flp/PilA